MCCTYSPNNILSYNKSNTRGSFMILVFGILFILWLFSPYPYWIIKPISSYNSQPVALLRSHLHPHRLRLVLLTCPHARYVSAHTAYCQTSLLAYTLFSHPLHFSVILLWSIKPTNNPSAVPTSGPSQSPSKIPTGSPSSKVCDEFFYFSAWLLSVD